MTCSVHKSVISGLTLAVTCAAAIAATAVPSFAQDRGATGVPPVAQVSPGPGSANEQITIYPPQQNTWTAPVPNAANHGFAVAKSTSMSQLLSYSDLDLTKPADLKELERRVTQTATDVCRELNKRFPADLYHSVTQFSPGRRYDCVQEAVKDGMNQVMRNRQLAELIKTP